MDIVDATQRPGQAPHDDTPLSSTDAEGSGCAHNGHAAPLPISGYRLGLCLITLGWSVHEAARRTDHPRTTVRRWLDGSQAVPCDIGARFERLAASIASDPFPRRVGRRRAPDPVMLSPHQDGKPRKAARAGIAASR